MPTLSGDRIRHSVVFTLAHAAGSEREADFLQAVAELASIPGVEAFELMREVSPKNAFDHALTMEFADRAAYEAYNAHPQHAGFVESRWDEEVTDFLEVDTVARSQS
jgi:heme-degrading monooxygenase HmoA